eukprot:1027840-Pyramimonas_sp.AAC.1
MRKVLLESTAIAAADAITQFYSVPTNSAAAQFRLHTPIGSVAEGVDLPRHWGQDLRQRGRNLERLSWTDCMAATET